MLRIGSLCRDGMSEFETIGATQSLMRLERAYDLMRALMKKWQMFGKCPVCFDRFRFDIPSDYGASQTVKGCITTYIFMEIASVRFRMLDFVQPVEVESAVVDCLQWSIDAISELRNAEHTMPFLQDVLSARLASVGSSLHAVSHTQARSRFHYSPTGSCIAGCQSRKSGSLCLS